MTEPAEGIYSQRVALGVLGQLQVEPSNGAPAGPVTSPATNWGFGAFATLIAAGTITNPFYIVGIRAYDNIAAQAGLHQLQLYYGASDINCGDWKFWIDPAINVYYDTNEIITGAPAGDPIPASSRIRAKLA